MIILLAGRQPDSEALVCSVAQAEKLIEIVCASLAATSTSLSGGIVTVAALTFWTQLVPKLALLERLLCAASMATFKQHQRGPSMLLRLLASHGLSAFLSLQGEASADRSTTSATYEEIRECIVLAQNNVQLAEEQTFKLASVACLSKLMAVEARMQAGGPPSTLPWNQFLTENIIASIPAAPLQLPDIHFLTMIVRHKPRWLPSVMGATTIEALLLKFACSVNIPLVMGYIDLLREVPLHTAGMITTALHPVASRVIQKQQKDIATMMRADAMEQESSNEHLLWQYRFNFSGLLH
ncbi:uncharacterized protein ACA1_248390 [Acanthamoeba castellanii str. Neff]|uniref:Uncharacterized protein n=1 Tax=Acanthamoeba castellanii (strain ATCC 30010 / Neff) TaxID=1257118 RepID=L8GXV9_ACACF|nr:uncharacterized protein ACA1_248390 [Acanthamoeba castellanii str. Neff]ELR17835.1 hypothetical protein ACA1_248390 [Acanthamoeba castellanii str. Neff]